MIKVGNMAKVATDAQLSDSLDHGNISYVTHIHYMQYLKNIKYEPYSSYVLQSRCSRT
jgi:hypothetical protein